MKNLSIKYDVNSELSQVFPSVVYQCSVLSRCHHDWVLLSKSDVNKFAPARLI